MRIPSLKAMRVGIDEMPAEAERACSASVSTLAKVISGYFSEAFSKIGPNIRHGPHQAAQKSTRTIPSFKISASKVWADKEIVDIPPRVSEICDIWK